MRAFIPSDRAHCYLPDVRGGVRVPVPQPRASLTLDESVSQDTAGTVRPGIQAFPERLAFATARAAAAAGSELIHQIHAVAGLSEEGAKALPLDRFFVLAVLALLEVADRDDGLHRPTEQLLEPF